MKETTLWNLTLQIPPSFEAVGVARHTVHHFLKEHKVRAGLLREFGLVITELLNNAIENGGNDSSSRLELELELNSQKIQLAVRGPGTSSGCDELRAALQKAEQFDEHGERGRGLFLIKSLMDEVKVRSLSGSRTEIRLQKSL